MSTCQRFRLDLSYDGSSFHGWSRQDGLRTVCGVVEEKLSLILRQPVTLVVAGRTDVGVHATGQVAHMDIVPCDVVGAGSVFLRRCAKFFPPDIRLLAITPVPSTFDARFAALSRTYVYRVSTAVCGPLPLERHYTAFNARPVDLGVLNDAAGVVVGLRNFAGFCRAKPFATTIRNLYEYHWSFDAHHHIYTAVVRADAFCWSMVRALVGATVRVGEGRKPLAWMEEILSRTTRYSDVVIAPACGLTLVHVEYPDEDGFAARVEKTRNVRTVSDLGAARGTGFC